MIPPDKLAAFLTDLSALSEKHGLTIGGCGCCNSPSIEPMIVDGSHRDERGGHYMTETENGGDLKWVPAGRGAPTPPIT